MEQDPYFVPTTEEELEDSGTNVASLGTNNSRRFMDQVRRRKVCFGLLFSFD
jgi:ribosome assembly protein 1